MKRIKAPNITPSALTGAILIAGMTSVVAGVYLSYGLSAALLSAGAMLMIVAVLLMRGIANGE